jgi:hypothetical protein
MILHSLSLVKRPSGQAKHSVRGVPLFCKMQEDSRASPRLSRQTPRSLHLPHTGIGILFVNGYIACLRCIPRSPRLRGCLGSSSWNIRLWDSSSAFAQAEWTILSATKPLSLPFFKRKRSPFQRPSAFAGKRMRPRTLILRRCSLYSVKSSARVSTHPVTMRSVRRQMSKIRSITHSPDGSSA